MARRNDNAAVGVVILGLVAIGLGLVIMKYTWPLLLVGSAGCLGLYLTKDRPREANPLRADQKLFGWSAGLAIAGLIGLAMSSTDDATPRTYGNPQPTYVNAPTPSYVQTPQTYVYTPPTYLSPAQQYEPAPVYAGPRSGGSVYYKNCAAARAAGAAPMRTTDPGYRAGLDRDGDGIACE